jgi:hypothetical protein
MPDPTFTASLNKDNPRARFLLSYPMYPALYDASTGHWKSGYIDTRITDLTWTGSGNANETVRITVRPVNHNACCNEEVEYTPAGNANAWGAATAYRHVTALNYGVPDSSALVEMDQTTISLVECWVELESNDFTDILSSIDLTLTYTATQTDIDVYSATGGTQYTNTVTLAEGADGAWGMATSAELASNVYAAITVQLLNLATTALGGPNSSSFAPMFQLSNPMIGGGQPVAQVGPFAIPFAAQKTITFEDYYAYVFAVNKGKINENAVLVTLPSSDVYNVCTFGLTGRARKDDIATAALTYTILVTTL